MPKPLQIIPILSLSLLLGAVACRGPARPPVRATLDVDLQMLTRDWEEGPRRDAVHAEVRKAAQRYAERLFPGDPMPSRLPKRVDGAKPLAKTLQKALIGGHQLTTHDQRPAWADGVQRPAESYDHDLPQAFPVEVRRGETPTLLARWSNMEVDRLIEDNKKTLKKRRWLKVSDRLTLTMSANQKLAFEEARSSFSRDRLEAYFSKRYIEKVVIYTMKRNDVIAKVTRGYGETPVWLLESFNQADFRTLQPGDEILIPVIRELSRGMKVPPALRVVDAAERPLTADQRSVLEGRLKRDLLGHARMAIDDSNVFERPAASAGASPRGRAGSGVLPGRLMPSAAIGGSARRQQPPAALLAPPTMVRPTITALERRVVVRPNETLSHYASWSGLRLDAIIAANPSMNIAQLNVGSKVVLPLSDTDWVAFISKRGAHGSAAQKARASAKAAAPSGGGAIARVTVRPGDTGGAIARRNKLDLRGLKALNPDVDLDRIRVGQRLRIR